MLDIAPNLLEKVENAFTTNLGRKRIKDLEKKIEKGTATYKDANRYAEEVGKALADAFTEIDDLPDGKMYYNIAEKVVKPQLEIEHEIVANYAEATQVMLNEGAGLGLKAVRPDIDSNRVQGILDKVSAADVYDTVRWVLNEPVINFAQNVVDTSVRENARFQASAGLRPKIIRTAEAPGQRTVTRGKKKYIYIVPCKWCNNLVGVYDYFEVSNTGNDVFRRHENCRCTVEYDPGDGRRQNVHSKEWANPNSQERQQRIDLAQEISKPQDNKPKDLEYEAVKAYAENSGVTFNPCKDLDRKLTEQEIIDRLGGGDKTKGSCSSLAFAYIGNKAGIDVLDFRGGNSQGTFATNANIRHISKMQGVKTIEVLDFSEIKASKAVFDQLESGKEYYFCTGRHAAIIRKAEKGVEYLELQQNPGIIGNPLYKVGESYGNKFKPLTTEVLRKRFSAKSSRKVMGIKLEQNALAIEAESLYNSDDFKTLLGYINTAEGQQQKGVGGFAK